MSKIPSGHSPAVPGNYANAHTDSDGPKIRHPAAREAPTKLEAGKSRSKNHILNLFRQIQAKFQDLGNLIRNIREPKKPTHKEAVPIPAAAKKATSKPVDMHKIISWNLELCFNSPDTQRAELLLLDVCKNQGTIKGLHDPNEIPANFDRLLTRAKYYLAEEYEKASESPTDKNLPDKKSIEKIAIQVLIENIKTPAVREQALEIFSSSFESDRGAFITGLQSLLSRSSMN